MSVSQVTEDQNSFPGNETGDSWLFLRNSLQGVPHSSPTIMKVRWLTLWWEWLFSSSYSFWLIFPQVPCLCVKITCNAFFIFSRIITLIAWADAKFVKRPTLHHVDVNCIIMKVHEERGREVPFCHCRSKKGKEGSNLLFPVSFASFHHLLPIWVLLGLGEAFGGLSSSLHRLKTP